ncbi:heterokaryon incompatibility protein-domain-containing protein [Xylariaceae sp. FL0804]|nr:heterokaryon incompatibility protein-domain-containing protein [Xylariaceae sp. FL0804]
MALMSGGSEGIGPIVWQLPPYVPRREVIYEPLDTTRSETRIVDIMPGAPSDPIHCRLRRVSLDGTIENQGNGGERAEKEAALPEALSYVWGRPDCKTTSITLHGEAGFAITANLGGALRDLRKPDRIRSIWIDALCIDQENSAERSYQVGQMNRIYAGASTVYAWLKVDGHDGLPSAFAAIEELARGPGLHLFPGRPPHVDPGLVDERHVLALGRFFQNEWWHRVWTVQEVVLPRAVTFVAGKHRLSLSTLLDATRNYHHHRNTCAVCAPQQLRGGTPLSALDYDRTFA